MIKVLSGKQMQNIDKKAINELNISGILLMENAGRSVHDEIVNLIDEKDIQSPLVLVVCGKGNNGGDGFVLARHLIQNDIQTLIVSISEESEIKDDALVNHNILKNFTDIIYYKDIDIENFSEMVSNADIVVDAILGTGINTDLKGEYKQIVEIINKYTEGYIVSVDIPSGIESDTGKILGSAIEADLTVTFYNPKLGNILYPGAEYCGDLVISDIGIPDFLTKDNEYNINLLTKEDVSGLIPDRKPDSHKGTYGSVLNIVGSKEMTGAAYMSAYTSLKVGCGYSFLASTKDVINTVSKMAPELVNIFIEQKEDDIDFLIEKSKKSKVVLIGSGLGLEQQTKEFVKKFIEKLVIEKIPAIFDADALNIISAENLEIPENSLLTPHAKELSRLLSVDVENILEDRIFYVRKAAEKFKSTVILKGARTLIAEADGAIYINPTGNSGMATAGSGDVLAGIIAGFVAQGLSLKDAALLGVYFHGLAGDIASEELSEYSLTATNIMDFISIAFKEIS